MVEWYPGMGKEGAPFLFFIVTSYPSVNVCLCVVQGMGTAFHFLEEIPHPCWYL